MGVFWSTPVHNISPLEFTKHVEPELRAKHFSPTEVADVEKLYHGYFEGRVPQDRVLTEQEVTEGLNWLELNHGKHSISREHIKTLAEVMKKNL